jgi:hypothetical protein
VPRLKSRPNPTPNRQHAGRECGNCWALDCQERKERPKDLIKFVVVKPVSGPGNRHQMGVPEMRENARRLRVRKKTFVTAQQ